MVVQVWRCESLDSNSEKCRSRADSVFTRYIRREGNPRARQRAMKSARRDFDLEPRSNVRPDLIIRGWVEVDGKPDSGVGRVVSFQREEVSPSPASKSLRS